MFGKHIPGLFVINKNTENGQSGISRKQLGIIYTNEVEKLEKRWGT
jgi:hypothetical protein